MKKINYFLFLLFLFSFTACNKDDDDKETLKTEIVTIFIDNSEIDNCRYTIKTKNKYVYTTEKLPNDYPTGEIKAEIRYRITNEMKNCGFAGSINIIKIVDFTEVQSNN